MNARLSLLAAACMLALAACGGETGPTDQAAATPASEAVATEAVPTEAVPVDAVVAEMNSGEDNLAVTSVN